MYNFSNKNISQAVWIQWYKTANKIKEKYTYTTVFTQYPCSPFGTQTDTTTHKVLTYIEYRAVSGVFRTIDHPLSTQRVCPSPLP
jgi:hypothetical protein